MKIALFAVVISVMKKQPLHMLSVFIEDAHGLCPPETLILSLLQEPEKCFLTDYTPDQTKMESFAQNKPQFLSLTRQKKALRESHDPAIK